MYKIIAMNGHELHGPTCPECGEHMDTTMPPPCQCPTMIYIPAGQHIHVDCPAHGRVRINGGPAVWA